ncbi:MAG: COX15/CtaA family protein [Alphaproteobacteria bacterium]|nr:COX15/CtaA family protein [Alphaproteobacteria bacterium]
MTVRSTFHPRDRPASQRAVALWLLIVAALIFAMVVLGGVTRLTHSGLSMVEWRPLTGWLPPFGEAAWQAEFEHYKQYPEYRKINLGMALAEFKGIFRFEYAHRVLGRLIGIAFALPFLYFLLRRRLEPGLTPKLVLMLVLGGLQGLLGWYMVMSGLVDRPDVSQYRLTAHLGLAVVVYGYILWTALGLLFAPEGAPAGLRRAMFLVATLVFLVMLSGGLVAGLDAGFSYNTFPLMNGDWVAAEAFSEEPWLRDLFENPASVQFEHRLLALVAALAVAALWIAARPAGGGRGAVSAVHALLAALVAQVTLGVLTLIYVVPVALAAAHQAGAMVLISVAVIAAQAMGP